MSTQSLPHNADAEKGVLGSMVLSGEARALCAQTPEEFFYIPAHRIVFQTLRTFEDNHPVDFVLLKNKLVAAGQLQEAGGVEFVNALYAFVPTAANWEYYLSILREFYQRRTTILECDRLKTTAYDLKSDYEQKFPEIIESALTKLAAKTRSDSRSFKTVLMDTIDEIEKRGQGESLSAVRFGVESLDQCLCGLQPGELIIIAAPTSGGKSALAMQAVLQTAQAGKKQAGKNCAIFSLEMTAGQITERMLAFMGPVSMRSLRTGKLAEHEYPRLTAAVNKLATLPLHIEDEFCTDISAIISRARQLHAKEPLSLIVVDYIQLVECRSVDKGANRETQVSEVARKLKLLTKELSTAVIALSQLNDDGLLRESRAIGHHADLVLGIEVASDSDDSHREIVIKKGRNTAYGQRVRVHFQGEYQTFSEPKTHLQAA